MRISITLISFILFFELFAQNLPLSFPFSTDVKFHEGYIDKLTNKYEVYHENYKVHNCCLSDFQNEYDNQLEYTVNDIKSGKFYADSTLQNYLNKILDEIISKNPILEKEDYYLMLSRKTIPNAYTTGDGTIVICMDLLRRFNSEAELAFVLGHEIAHNYFNHAMQGIDNRILFFNDKKTQEYINTIKRSVYNKNKMIDEFLIKYAFNRNKHGRMFELDCDSFSIELLKNTKYSPYAAIGVLEILDSVDSKMFNSTLEYNNFFDFESYPFKPSWEISEKRNSFFLSAAVKEELSEEKKQLKDSLKTHPDCQIRIEKAKELLKGFENNGKDFIVSKEYFNDLIFQLEFEAIESDFHYKKVNIALYKALQLLHKYPDEPYLYIALSRGFQTLSEGQENHEFGKYVVKTNHFFPKEFNDFTTFLEKLSLEDLKQIAYYILKENKELAEPHPDFPETFNTSKNKTIKPQTIKY